MLTAYGRARKPRPHAVRRRGKHHQALLYAAGLPFVLLGSVLVGFMVYLGFRHVLPYKAPKLYAVHAGVLLYLFAAFFFHYLRAACLDPGTPRSPAYMRLLREAMEVGSLPHGAVADAATTWQRQGRMHDPIAFRWSTCKHTGHKKPPRAHFDAVTGRLVLNMDHYCVWLFNTVGYLNYRHYVLTLLYVEFGAVFGFFETLALYTKHETGNLPVWLAAHNSPTRHQDDREAWWNICAACAVVFIVVGQLLCWHIRVCIIRGFTTIEFYASCKTGLRTTMMDSPYYWGSRAKNCHRVFGGVEAFDCNIRTILHVLTPSTTAPPWPPYPCKRLLAMLALNPPGDSRV